MTRGSKGGSRAKYDDRKRFDIAADLLCDVYTMQSIADAHGVSIGFVSKVKTAMRATGSPLTVQTTKRGRPRVVNAEMEALILAFLDDYPAAFLDEVQDLLRDEYPDDYICRTAIYEVLKRLRLTHKRISRINPRRDEGLRENHFVRRMAYRADQIIAVDESAANEQTADRKYGWSLKGLPCRVALTQRSGARWSILPAMTINGYLTVEVRQGSFNAVQFGNFVERLLPHTTPHPGPRSVLLMDNASTHVSAMNTDRMKRLLREHRVKVLWLPPYSPDLNPIEETFHELKQWMRKNRQIMLSYGEYFEGFIRYAVDCVCPPRNARGYFRSAGYDVANEGDGEVVGEVNWSFA